MAQQAPLLDRVEQVKSDIRRQIEITHLIVTRCVKERERDRVQIRQAMELVARSCEHLEKTDAA
jgi:hypothetical protein